MGRGNGEITTIDKAIDDICLGVTTPIKMICRIVNSSIDCVCDTFIEDEEERKRVKKGLIIGLGTYIVGNMFPRR